MRDIGGSPAPGRAGQQAVADSLLRSLLDAPPAMLGRSPGVEVHTLVSSEHVPLYLFAAKSLARFWDGPRAVVHDDGTLTDEDRGVLRAHVPGLRIATRPEADARVAPLLEQYPTVAAVRRNNVRILQLVDYFLLAEADTVIGMDSDVVFLRRPDDLIQWVDDRTDPAAFRYSPEEGWEPMGVHWISDHLPGVPHVRYMCCGFTAARAARLLDLSYIEQMLARLPSEIRFYPRYVTQMCYSLLGGRLGEAGVSSLGEPYRSGRLEWLPDIPDRVICHYMASHERNGLLDNLVEEAPLLRRAIEADDVVH
jgi:hypothetical protein